MRRLEGAIIILEAIMSTKRKQHILGGVLLSTSLLFAGLAITTLTLELKRNTKGEQDEEYSE